jgi:hypothetical protein
MFICQKVWELSNHQYADQSRTAKGKNVVVRDEFRNKMMKPQNPGIGKWKENIRLKPACRVKLNSSMLIEKYIRQQQQQKRPQGQQRGFKGERSPGYYYVPNDPRGHHAWGGYEWANEGRTLHVSRARSWEHAKTRRGWVPWSHHRETVGR